MTRPINSRQSRQRKSLLWAPARAISSQQCAEAAGGGNKTGSDAVCSMEVRREVLAVFLEKKCRFNNSELRCSESEWIHISRHCCTTNTAEDIFIREYMYIVPALCGNKSFICKMMHSKTTLISHSSHFHPGVS